MARKFNVGDKVVLSNNAVLRLTSRFSGLVGEVVDYKYVEYDSGYYHVDFGGAGKVSREKPSNFEKTSRSSVTSRDVLVAEVESLKSKLSDAINKLTFIDEVGTNTTFI